MDGTKEAKKYLELVLALDIPIKRPIHPSIPIYTQNEAWANSTEVKKLIGALKSDPSNSKFDDKLQYLGSQGARTSMVELAVWLTQRTKSVGAASALQDLANYNNAQEIEVYGVMLLASLNTSEEFDFSNGVSLRSAENIPNSALALRISENSFNSVLPLPSVQNVLIAPYKQTVSHGDDREKPGFCQTIPTKAMDETRLCMVLARSDQFCSIHSMGYGTVAPDHLPFPQSFNGWHVTPCKYPPPSPEMIGIELHQAENLIKSLGNLNPEARQKLTLPLSKLNDYFSETHSVDGAVSLRTCLESLFLDGHKTGELTFRLALRASKFLASNLDDRKHVLRVFKQAYDVSSEAVHTGKLPTKHFESLAKAAELAKKALKKIMEHGFPNWSSIELIDGQGDS